MHKEIKIFIIGNSGLILQFNMSNNIISVDSNNYRKDYQLLKKDNLQQRFETCHKIFIILQIKDNNHNVKEIIHI